MFSFAKEELITAVWKTGLPLSSWKRLTADVCEIVTKEQQLEKNVEHFSGNVLQQDSAERLMTSCFPTVTSGEMKVFISESPEL